MAKKCIYCTRKTPKGFAVGEGQYVCNSCAGKSQDYLTQLLRLWKPHLVDGVPPLNPNPHQTKPKNAKRKRR